MFPPAVRFHFKTVCTLPVFAPALMVIEVPSFHEQEWHFSLRLSEPRFMALKGHFIRCTSDSVLAQMPFCRPQFLPQFQMNV